MQFTQIFDIALAADQFCSQNSTRDATFVQLFHGALVQTWQTVVDRQISKIFQVGNLFVNRMIHTFGVDSVL